MEISIREMEPADAHAVSALVTQLGYQRSPADICAWIDDLRRVPREQAVFVALLQREVIGWIDVSVEHRLQSPRFALIGGLVVKDGVRSRGIGRALCRRAEEWAWQQGVVKVRVTSRSTRADAHRFYLRDGYRETKTSLVFEKPRPLS